MIQKPPLLAIQPQDVSRVTELLSKHDIKHALLEQESNHSIAPEKVPDPKRKTVVHQQLDQVLDLLTELKQLEVIVQSGVDNVDFCPISDCPRLKQPFDLLAEVVDVLEETRSSFKSKQLAELRKKLQDNLKQTD